MSDVINRVNSINVWVDGHLINSLLDITATLIFLYYGMTRTDFWEVSMNWIVRILLKACQVGVQILIWFIIGCIIWELTGVIVDKLEGMKMKKKRHFGLGGKKAPQTQWEAEQEARRAMEVATTQVQTIMDLCLEFEKEHGRNVKQWDIFAITSFAARISEIGPNTGK